MLGSVANRLYFVSYKFGGKMKLKSLTIILIFLGIFLSSSASAHVLKFVDADYTPIGNQTFILFYKHRHIHSIHTRTNSSGISKIELPSELYYIHKWQVNLFTYRPEPSDCWNLEDVKISKNRTNIIRMSVIQSSHNCYRP